MKVIIWINQYLDPRIEKRIEWFSLYGYDVYLSCFKCIKQFIPCSNKKYKYISYGEIFFSQQNIIYISGPRILIYNFLLIWFLSKKNIIFIEISDLPLRSKYEIINGFLSKIFNMFLSRLSSNIIITSNVFIKKLPQKRNYLYIENIANDKISNLLYNIEINTDYIYKIKIGYIGIIRYIDQLEMIMKFVYDCNNAELHIFGLPEEKIDKLIRRYKKHNNIYLHGCYNYEKDIVRIYSYIDIVYSVYDADQINVQLALPNKLYEAALAKKWIIVAEKTYLGKVITDARIGIEVPYKKKDYKRFKKVLIKFLDQICKRQIKYNLSYSKLIFKKSLEQKKLFITYIKTATSSVILPFSNPSKSRD